MNQKKAITSMSALAQPIRFAAMVTLSRPGAAGMSVSELATAVGGILHNSMSVHLAVLARAGLVKSVKNGRETIYRANRAVLGELGSLLVELSGSTESAE